MKKLLGIGLTAVLVSACGGIVDERPLTADNDRFVVGGNSSAAALSLSGDLARVSVGVEHAVRADINADDFGTFIALTAPRADGGAIMGGLFMDGIDLASLEAGTVIRSQPFAGRLSIEAPDGSVQDMDNGAWVDSIGCSGDVEGDWDTDEPANEVVIEVRDGETPEDVVVEFQSEFDSGSLEGVAIIEG